MTIQVQVKNLNSRANAIIEVVTVDEYKDSVELGPTHRITLSRGLLAGGQELNVFVTSTQHLEVIERKNDL